MSYIYRREPLRQDEELRLLSTVQAGRERLAVVLFLETGMRISELAELDLRAIDWQLHRVTVYGKGGKTGHNSKRRVIPLSKKAMEVLAPNMGLLERRLNEQRKGRTYSVWVHCRTMNRLVHTCANRALITRNVCPHMLRHTFAVNCLRKGLDVRYVMQLLGHERLATTQGYLNLSPDDVCEQFHKKWDGNA